MKNYAILISILSLVVFAACPAKREAQEGALLPATEAPEAPVGALDEAAEEAMEEVAETTTTEEQMEIELRRKVTSGEITPKELAKMILQSESKKKPDISTVLGLHIPEIKPEPAVEFISDEEMDYCTKPVVAPTVKKYSLVVVQAANISMTDRLVKLF